jgi:hypothetical protein
VFALANLIGAILSVVVAAAVSNLDVGFVFVTAAFAAAFLYWASLTPRAATGAYVVITWITIVCAPLAVEHVGWSAVALYLPFKVAELLIAIAAFRLAKAWATRAHAAEGGTIGTGRAPRTRSAVLLRWISFSGLLCLSVGFGVMAAYPEPGSGANDVGFALWWGIGTPLLAVAGIAKIVRRVRRRNGPSARSAHQDDVELSTL